MHGFDNSRVAILTNIPTNISIMFFRVAFPWIAGIFVEKKWVKKVTTRHIGGFICSLAGLPLIFMGTLPCAAEEDNIIYILLFGSVRGANYFSLNPTIIDLQEHYQNQLLTFSVFIGGIPGYLVPHMRN